MHYLNLNVTCLVLAFVLSSLAPARSEPPEVVASIKPIHSLVAGVMAGVGSPRLLIPGGMSPHIYALKPSEATLLSRAKIVFLIGPGLEVVLAPVVSGLARNARVVRLIEAPGLRLHPLRTTKEWNAEGDHHGHAHSTHGKVVGSAQTLDHHIWLDPENAKSIVARVVAELAAVDPSNAERYRANGRQSSAAIDAVNVKARLSLADVRDTPFLVFHDAYQYMERAFGLTVLGAVAISPERQPGPRTLSELRRLIRSSKAACIFSEPQFPSRIVETLISATGARAGVLDPLGVDLDPGPELYRELLMMNVSAIRTCFSQRKT